MPLQIVRNDITKMEVDAIVNSTNEDLLVGGFGVDAGIHEAAGPGLAEELESIGFCPTGSAVMTNAYGISQCRKIIHAVGPVYQDGQHGERELLLRCYRSVFALARKAGCRSLAMPAISAGFYGFPKAEAYSIATAAAREFLLSLDEDEEMTIYFVLFGSEMLEISKKLQDDVSRYIADHYIDMRRNELQQFYACNFSPEAAFGNPPKAQARRPNVPAAKETAFARNYEPAPQMEMECCPMAASVDETDYRSQDKSFAEMCEWWCQQKKITPGEFYVQANINRKMFWNMRKHGALQVPKKTNVLACAIGLKLNLEETRDLLMRAGHALSPYYELDVVVSYFIENRKYNIYELNSELFDRDLPLLGSAMD